VSWLGRSSVDWCRWPGPWLTILTLSLFYISMQRARIRNVHVRRCVLYSFDVVLWLGLAGVGVGALRWILPALGGAGPRSGWAAAAGGSVLPEQPVVIALLSVCGIVVAGYRLIVAYRHYLRFDHPTLTVLAAQIVALLVFLNIMAAAAVV
jgi:hypothetical protein